MSDAPERVWIDDERHEHHWHEGAPPTTYRHVLGEYIRADIAAAQLAEANARADAAIAERDQAKKFRDFVLMKASERADAASALATERAAKACDAIAGNTADFSRDHRRAAGQCAAMIRAEAPMSPLAAALQLPEVRAMVEAMQKRDTLRVCTTTGGPNHEGQKWVHWLDYQELRQRIDTALAALTAAGGGE